VKAGIYIKKALGDKFAGMRIRVGVFNTMYPQTKQRPEEIPVAAVAAIHEFGSPRRNIPKRSFLLEPIKRELPKIAQKAKNLNDMGLMLENACKDEIETEGHGSWDGFSDNYRTRPSGQPVDGSSKLLMDTGLLLKSITHKVEGV